MKNQCKSLILASRIQADRGFTLLVTLGLIVLVTGLVVAFFSRTTSALQISAAYRNHLEATGLSKIAAESITEELQKELFAGSKSQKVGLSTIYYPATSSSIAPERVGTSDLLPNLIKRSKRGEFLFSPGEAHPAFSSYPPLQSASDEATDRPSLDGRSISSERWNYGLFLPLSGSGDRTPSTDFVVPDWIYTTEAGTSVTDFRSLLLEKQGKRVVGRYAYCVYDQGGMLDVNVAGYPSVIEQKEAARKGGLGFASLVPIFKRAGMGQGEALTASDYLVQWRNRATLSEGEPSKGYLNYLLTPGRSFLNVGGTSARSDLLFISRQQLIDFVLKELPGAITARREVLKWMTTFTRDVPQPSFQPPDLGLPQRPKILGTSGRDAVIAGGNLSVGKDNLINPKIPEIRVQNPFKRASDQTMAKVGEPLMKWRFPLSRLEWLTCDGSAESLGSGDPRYREEGTDKAVLDSFGLTWDKSNKRWIYDHDGDGKLGNNNKILTLQEVARLSLGREPDFIELLQAGLYAGSLGKSFVLRWTTSPSPNRYDELMYGWAANTSFSNYELRDAYTEIQILQIAAAMIDQTDTDSFPTQIVIKNPRTNSFYLPVVGVERVPMLHRLYTTISTRDITSALATDGFSLAIVPEFWDPHESTNSLPSGGLVPQKFRVTLTRKNISGSYVFNSFAAGYFTNDASELGQTTSSSYEFQGANISGGPAAYRPGVDFTEPRYVYDPVSNGNSIRNYISAIGVFPETAGLTFKQVYPLGSLPFSASVKMSTISQFSWNDLSVLFIGGWFPKTGDPEDGYGFTVKLEGQDASGYWRLISTMRNNQSFLPHAKNPAAGGGNTSPQEGFMSQTLTNLSKYASIFALDPRSERFPPSSSVLASNYGQAPVKTIDYNTTWRPNYSSLGARAYRYESNGSQLAPPVGWVTTLRGGEIYYAMGLLSQNKSGSGTYYADPDGVVRPGDAFYATTTDEDPICQPGGSNPARSIILNRPFRNVGELGYAFRGAPWKTIDFFTDKSADGALLDLFCIIEPPKSGEGYVAGAVNLNTRNPEVIESLLSTNTQGAMMDESPGGSATYLSESDVKKMAKAWVDTTLQNPVSNHSEIVARVSASNMVPSGKDGNYKRRRESAVRALSGGTSTRIWNLMIDLVAQTGELSPQAKSLADFTVQGEKRVWVHLSIDRLTGKILERKTEVVRE